MADVELVIKIPDEAKQAFDNAENNELKGGFYDHGGVIGSAIKNGKVLPKGHGRLIDVDAMIKDFNTFQDSFVLEFDWNTNKLIGIKCNAPTIIEADKGEE